MSVSELSATEKQQQHLHALGILEMIKVSYSTIGGERIGGELRKIYPAVTFLFGTDSHDVFVSPGWSIQRCQAADRTASPATANAASATCCTGPSDGKWLIPKGRSLDDSSEGQSVVPSPCQALHALVCISVVSSPVAGTVISPPAQASSVALHSLID